MNYDFSERESSFLTNLYEVIGPFAARNPMDEPGQQARENISQGVAQLAATPYMNLAAEDVPNGIGRPCLTAAMEVVASVSPSLYLSVEYSIRMLGRALDRWGTDSQKEIFLQPLVEGRQLGALALFDTAAETEDYFSGTTGERRGDAVSITGSKQFVVNGPVAAVTGVAGTLDGQPAIFMVEEDTPGLWVKDSGETFGYPGATFSTLKMDKCSIPFQNIILPGDGSGVSSILRFWENHVLTGASLGLMKTALDSARDYAKMKKSGGRPIIANQVIGFKLAEMLTRYQSARLLSMRAAWAAENDPDQADELAFCAKVFCTEAAENVCSDALSILGPSCFFGPHPIQLAYRCAKYGQVFGTSTELSRTKLGDAALGGRI